MVEQAQETAAGAIPGRGRRRGRGGAAVSGRSATAGAGGGGEANDGAGGIVPSPASVYPTASAIAAPRAAPGDSPLDATAAALEAANTGSVPLRVSGSAGSGPGAAGSSSSARKKRGGKDALPGRAGSGGMGAPGSGGTFFGVSEREQSEIMANELRAGTYECGVCFETVEPKSQIWACGTCYRILHLVCVRTWRDKSVTATGKPSDPWRCPGCQAVQTHIPLGRCFCGKHRNPDPDPYLTPHSCGQLCGRHRGHGCPHPCESVCHPGPCSPCAAMGPIRTCGCGRTSYRTRCGAPESDPATAAGGARSCGAVCGKPLSCGVKSHKCTRTCHTGPCGSCDRYVQQSCYCGRCTEPRLCQGAGAEKSAPARSRQLKCGDSGAAGPGIAVLERGEADHGAQVGFPLQPSVYLNAAADAAGPSSSSSRAPVASSSSSSSDALALLLSAAGGAPTDEIAALISAAATHVRVRIAPTQLRFERQMEQHILESLPSVQKDGEGVEDKGRGGDAAQAHEAPAELPTALPRASSSATGHFSCGASCGAWLDCGLHRCTSSCHTGDCSGCPTLPSRCDTCACGKSAALACLDYAPRATCLDPLPTCGGVCGKSLSCGHACDAVCHNGTCPPCRVPVVAECRCGGMELVLPCESVYVLAAAGGDLHAVQRRVHAAESLRQKAKQRSSWSAPTGSKAGASDAAAEAETEADILAPHAIARGSAPVPPAVTHALRGYPVEAVMTLLHCARTCSRKLACGRHKCNRQCCPLASRTDEFGEARAESIALLSAQLRSALPPGAHAPPEAVVAPAGQRAGHLCGRVCGKPLPCGKHSCDNLCHAGPCGECGHVDYDAPLACRCGRTTIAPPVRCGTKLPTCPCRCSVPRPCGHAHPSWHTCHPGACPPCVQPVSVMCGSGHELRNNIPCHIGVVVCSRPCGKTLPCGEHACPRQCHTGPCLPAEVIAEHESARAAILRGAEAFAASVVAATRDEWPGAVQGSAGAAGGAGAQESSNAPGDSNASASSSAGPAAPDFAGARLKAQALSAASSSGVLDVDELYAAAREEHRRANAYKARIPCGHKCARRRALCEHTCTASCHPNRSCPEVACEETTTILCACGRLAAQVPCGHGAAPPGSDVELDLSARRVPCDELCASAARARAFGEAIGVIPSPDSLGGLGGIGGGGGAGGAYEGLTMDNGDRLFIHAGKLGYCPYPDALLLYARDNPTVADKAEKSVRDLLLNPSKYDGSAKGGSGLDLAPMHRTHRAFVHQLAEIYGVNSTSFGVEPRRYVRLSRRIVGERASNGPKLQGGMVSERGSVPLVVNGPETPRPEGPGGDSASRVLSSIGTSLGPGVVVLPSLTLVEAVQVHAARLEKIAGPSAASSSVTIPASSGVGGGGGLAARMASMSGMGAAGAGSGALPRPGAGSSWARLTAAPSSSSASPFGASHSGLGAGAGAGAGEGSHTGSLPLNSGGTSGAMHPSEPTVATMDKSQIGCVLHAYNIRRSTQEDSIREVLESAGGEAAGAFRMRRLDDHNALLYYDTQGRAARALDAFATGESKGVMARFRLRYWGVGVAQHLSLVNTRASAAPPPPPPAPMRSFESVRLTLPSAAHGAGPSGGVRTWLGDAPATDGGRGASSGSSSLPRREGDLDDGSAW